MRFIIIYLFYNEFDDDRILEYLEFGLESKNTC